MPETKGNQGKTAEYLDQFDSSPYSYPANDRQTVSGVSKKKGSWRPEK